MGEKYTIEKDTVIIDGKQIEVVKFTKKDVLAYLDEAIAYWRELEDMDMAALYIDAFQSMRTSLFGELKEEERENDTA